MKNAIVALTRGYPEQKNLYDELLQRNKSIYEHINKKRDYPADIILFHEGNISEKDQSYLTKESAEPLKFINVSKYFEGKNSDHVNDLGSDVWVDKIMLYLNPLI